MCNVLSYNNGTPNFCGIGVSRKIKENIAIEVKYYFPNTNFNPDRTLASPYRFLTTEEEIDNYNDIGKLIRRWSYHYFDVGIRYEAFSAKNQSLSFRQNLSLAYGTDVYLTDLGALWISSDEPFHIIYRQYDKRKKVHYGGVTGIAYDYHLWKNKINIGLDVAVRYYTGGFPFQVNYGLHLGYNF